MSVHCWWAGDGNEVAGSYLCALDLTSSPSVIACSRTGMPVQAGTSPQAVAKGAYALDPAATKKAAVQKGLIIAATGECIG